MHNNLVFKKMLHLTGCGKNKPLTREIFALGGEPDVTDSLIRGWRDDPHSPRGKAMPDWALAAWFDGLFLYRDQQSAKNKKVFDFE